jgi:hypothetical protein
MLAGGRGMHREQFSESTPPHTHTHMHVPPVCTFCASCVYVLEVMFARDQFHGG